MDFPSAHSKDYSPYPIVLLCMDYAISRNQGFMKIGRKSVSPCKCFFGYVVTLLFFALKFAVFRNLIREIWFKKSGSANVDFFSGSRKVVDQKNRWVDQK